MHYNNLIVGFAITPELGAAVKGKEAWFKKEFTKRVIQLKEAK